VAKTASVLSSFEMGWFLTLKGIAFVALRLDFSTVYSHDCQPICLQNRLQSYL